MRSARAKAFRDSHLHTMNKFDAWRTPDPSPAAIPALTAEHPCVTTAPQSNVAEQHESSGPNARYARMPGGPRRKRPPRYDDLREAVTMLEDGTDRAARIRRLTTPAGC